MDARVMFIETSDDSVGSHLDGLLAAVASPTVGVAVVANDSGKLQALALKNRAVPLPVPMVRDPSPVADFRSLRSLYGTIKRYNPDIVIFGTPKAALLGAVASWAARVPRRVHVLHGLRVETMTGARRRLFLLIDRLTEALSTCNIAVGHGLANRSVQIGSMRSLPRVLGYGSAQGVNVSRFRRSHQVRDADELVIGFVGRLTADKGIDILCRAFSELSVDYPATKLYLIGPHEDIEGLRPSTQEAIRNDPRIIAPGSTREVATEMARFDLLCLPTRREGLPTVLLEAAAVGTPVVATRATGVEDVVDDECAWLVPVDDADSLAAALREALSSPAERSRRAELAHRRVLRRYEQSTVWAAWREFIEEQLSMPAGEARARR